MASYIRMLKLVNFSKSYGSKQVIGIDALCIPEGLTWLIGANGAGKTTLLRIIAGIEPFKGNLLLGDIDIRVSPVDYRRKVNFGEAEPLFPTFLTGMELIQLFCSAKRAPKEQANELIQAFQVQSFIEQTIGTYSSGMLKKLSLILAFLGEPSLILLDEPLITLDEPAQQMLLELIAISYLKKNINFIISSHQELEIWKNIPVQRLRIQDTTIELI